jgi:hypothetical protein
VVVGHNYHHYDGGSFTDLEEAKLAAIALRNKLYTHNIERAVAIADVCGSARLT